MMRGLIITVYISLLLVIITLYAFGVITILQRVESRFDILSTELWQTKQDLSNQIVETMEEK